MLCDDVGLGKTLTVLSLCALDRASAEEAGAVSPTGAERSSASAGSTYSFAETSDPAALRHWRVRYKPSSYGVACDVGHLFERQMRSVLMRAEKVPLRVLPRTTLIVMPVSIVGQWATEIERFCPDSRYIIFHGNKRLRYTAEDFSQADFVLTTFETLGGHLRAESDPVGWMVEQFGREAAGVGEDGRRHMDRWRAVQHLAESIFPSVPEISEGGLTFERMQEASPFVWQMKNSANGEKIFTCSYLRVRVNHEGLGRLSRRNLHYSGEFLDNLIELLLGIESPVADAMTTEEELSTEARNKSSTVVPLWSVLTLLRDHVAVSDKVRKELVGAVVFPLLRRCLQRYWRAMNVPADDVLRFRHFQFRRLVIDEGHLIGSTSLCHLLRADRRWVLSGTPIANFNTTNLAHPLRVLQLPAADAYFRGDRRNMMTGGFSHRSLHFHIMLAKQSVWRRYGSVLPTDAAIPPSIMDAIQTQAFWHSSIAVQDCLCRRCCAELQRRGGLGLGSPRELPSDVLEATEEATHGSENDIQCHRGVLLSMLHQWVIRHERWQIDARTFALPPVEHHAVVVQLDAAERTIYDRVAPLIELVGQRWHRQGLLQRRMGKLLQWIEGLARLCLHAELVRDSVARVRTLEDVQAAAPVQPSVFDAAAAATEYLERITFIECSPQSAVVWAQETEMALLRERGRSNAPRLTESVVKELHDLGEVPPLLPSCGVCLELMQQPTLLSCYHMFCKACILGVVENSWSMRGGSRCPYCRTGLQDAEMRVLQLNYAEEGEADTAEGSSSSASDEASHATPNAAEVPLEVSLEAIGHGSRARAMVELLHSIWSSSPEDGVLVFCKYPDMLRRVAVYVEAELGCLPCVIDGTTTLNRRRKIFGSLQPASVRPPNSEGAYSAPPARRLLFVTTRAANCGLNLTFANHIIFLGPTLNPAVEVQAIGRVHRFGQTKTVHVHHLFTENTIEQRIRERSERLLSQMGSAHTTAATAATATAADGHLDAAERARLTQYGAMAPTDMMQLLSFSPLL